MKKILSLILILGFGVINSGCLSNLMKVTEMNPRPKIDLPPQYSKQSLALDIDQSIKDNFKIETNNMITITVSGYRKSLENGFQNGFKDYFRIEQSKSASDLTIYLKKITYDAPYCSYSAKLNKRNGEAQSISSGRIKAEGKNPTDVTKKGIEMMYEQIANDFFIAKNTVKSDSDMLLAVMDFIPNGLSMDLASKTSEMIRNTFISKGGYTIVERSQMNLILKEQGFQMTGCTDTSCAVKVGKLLSARKILVGKVMKVGKSIIISGRIVDVEKGVGEAASNVKALNEDDLYNAVNDFVDKIK